MASVFDHLHIKRNTVGSSNELSLDVLDAARSDLADKSSRSSSPKPPGSYKGSYHGVAGTSTLSGVAEVEKRKKARRAYSIRIWIVAAFVAVVGVSAVLWLGYQHYLSIQDFPTRFDSLVGQFKEEDDFLAEVDALMTGIDDKTGRAAREQATAKIPSVRDDVERIRRNAQSASPLTMTDEDKAILGQVIEGIDAREAMLDSAKSAFELATERDKQVESVSSAWNSVVDAAQNAKDASALANKAVTEKETEEAIERTSQTQESLNKALTSIKTIDASNNEVDLSAQIAYLEQKVKSLGYAIETGQALLDGDRSKAAEMNVKYNEADQQAAEQAEKLPLAPEIVVKESFDKKLSDFVQSYDASRKQAISTDAAIRNYLERR